MEKDWKFILMEKNIKESFTIIKNKDKVHIHLKMAVYIMVFFFYYSFTKYKNIDY